MKKIFIYLTNVLSVICILNKSIALAQDQPQIQNVSVRAPENIKVDGELNEWADKSLNAYNSANRIFYVVSNDDDNFYLTVKGLGTSVANKVLTAGITFTISPSTVKSKRPKDAKNVSLTYPTLQKDARNVQYIISPVIGVATFINDPVKYKKQIDSLQHEADLRVEAKVKYIVVAGIKGVKDTLSVYNDKGIKAALHFSKRQPIIEMAIPLKYLNINASEPFSYNIKLNTPPSSPSSASDMQDILQTDQKGPSPDELYRFTDTDLWGVYTLIKKN